MAGLAHEGEFPRPIQVALGHQAGAERMASILRGIQSGGLGGALDDEADGILVQTSGGEMAVPVDAPE